MAVKAKRKVKSNKKGPTVKIPRHLQEPVQFIPYTGNRWQIPPGMKVNKGVQNKFKQFETYNQEYILQKLRSYNKLLLTHVHFVPFNMDGAQKWTPPELVVSFLKEQMYRNMHEWKAVHRIYTTLFKMRKMLNGLIHRWRINKCMNNTKNTEDLVTLEYPKKLVRILDFPMRLSYIFEASTIRKIIELRITTSDYMFPNPLPAINPFTNQPLSRGQLMSVIDQCKKHGEYSWILDRLYASEGDLKLFCIRFRQPIKIMAIENHFKGEIYKYKDEIIDFFEIQAERHNLDDDNTDKFLERINQRPNCPLIKQWTVVTRDYYIANELNDTGMILGLSKKIILLIAKTYSLLNR